MAREIHSTVIDGDRYEMTMFGASQGYRIFHRLFKILGPVLGKVMDAAVDVQDIRDVDLSSGAVAEGLQALSGAMKESDLDYLIDAMRKCTHVGIGGSEKTTPLAGVFEMHFSGRIGSMFKWLAWGLKVQYSSFGDAFASLRPPSEGDASQAATPASRSQSQSQ